jgi:hypothetical protein
MVEDVNFGGLLQIACHTIPADLAKSLIKDCFQPDTMELVLPGRGRIAVTEQSVSHTSWSTDSGEEVKYELQVEAIKFIHDKYDIVFGTTPRIEAICERVRKTRKQMKIS